MLTVFILSVSLALDALSVSITEGALVIEKRLTLAFKLALTFGAFQSGMALLGVGLNGLFAGTLDRVDHWIAFAIFLLLGLKMIKEGLSEEEKEHRTLTWKVLFLLAFATSIDAGAAGMTLPLLGPAVSVSLILIGASTLVLCFFGTLLGSFLKKTFTKLPLEVIGGVVLILLAIKALMEGL